MAPVIFNIILVILGNGKRPNAINVAKKNKVLYSNDIIGYLRKSRNSAIDLFEWKRKFIKMAGNKDSKAFLLY